MSQIMTDPFTTESFLPKNLETNTNSPLENKTESKAKEALKMIGRIFLYFAVGVALTVGVTVVAALIAASVHTAIGPVIIGGALLALIGHVAPNALRGLVAA